MNYVVSPGSTRRWAIDSRSKTPKKSQRRAGECNYKMKGDAKDPGAIVTKFGQSEKLPIVNVLYSQSVALTLAIRLSRVAWMARQGLAVKR
jgi:hypothetical protein